MSHQIHAPLALVNGRIGRLTAELTNPATAAAYTPAERDRIGRAALALAVAAGAGCRHLPLVVELDAVQTALDTDPGEQLAADVVGICDDLLARVVAQRAHAVAIMIGAAR